MLEKKFKFKEEEDIIINNIDFDKINKTTNSNNVKTSKNNVQKRYYGQASKKIIDTGKSNTSKLLINLGENLHQPVYKNPIELKQVKSTCFPSEKTTSFNLNNSNTIDSNEICLDNLGNFQPTVKKLYDFSYLKNKLYFKGIIVDNTTKDFFVSADVSQLEDNSLYVNFNTQVFKIGLDLDLYQCSSVVIQDALIDYKNTLLVSQFNDKSYFKKHGIDDDAIGMDQHPFIAIKGVFLDLLTTQLETRYLVFTLSSSSNLSDGHIQSKNFYSGISNSEVQHNLFKPYSKIHSIRSMKEEELTNINTKTKLKDIELLQQQEYNTLLNLHNTFLIKYNLQKEIVNNLITTDPFTGKKYSFICLGDNKHIFNSEVLQKFITNKLDTKDNVSNNNNIEERVQVNTFFKKKFYLLSLFVEKHSLTLPFFYEKSVYIDNIIKKIHKIHEKDISNEHEQDVSIFKNDNL